MTENIESGKLYRVLTDVTNNIWDRLSFWKKASDVEFDDGYDLEKNRPIAILQRGKLYTEGSVAYINSAPSWVRLKCITAGTTAVNAPSTYSTISEIGQVITDGTAKFIAISVLPTDTLSNNQYAMPAMSLVNSIDSQLLANGNKFYFDYHDGQYGYNTSADRNIETFVAF